MLGSDIQIHTEVRCNIGRIRFNSFEGTLVPLMTTDNGWPDFLRVHAILHWNYHEIWEYIRQENVPYCKLYDEGYTSLGDKSNTRPNPRLVGPGGVRSPAHSLTDPAEERESRLLA